MTQLAETSLARGTAREHDGAARADAARVRRIADGQTWKALLADVSVPQVTQSYAYGAGKEAEGWHVVRVAFEVDGRTAAICQILEKRVAGVRLATRVNRGPMFLSAEPGDDEVVAVHRALRKGWGRALTGPLLLAPALPGTERNRALMREAGYWRRGKEGWGSAHLDLSLSEEELFASFNSTYRNRYRKALKLGVTTEITQSEEAVEWLIGRHEVHMKQCGVRYCGIGFFQALSAASDNDFFIARAFHQGEPVGGTAIIHAGAMAEYDVGWHSPDARDLNLGNLLMWTSICEAKRRGASIFDVGGLLEAKGGFSQFKRGMNGMEYELVEEWFAI